MLGKENALENLPRTEDKEYCFLPSEVLGSWIIKTSISLEKHGSWLKEKYSKTLKEKGFPAQAQKDYDAIQNIKQQGAERANRYCEKNVRVIP